MQARIRLEKRTHAGYLSLFLVGRHGRTLQASITLRWIQGSMRPGENRTLACIRQAEVVARIGPTAAGGRHPSVASESGVAPYLRIAVSALLRGHGTGDQRANPASHGRDVNTRPSSHLAYEPRP